MLVWSIFFSFVGTYYILQRLRVFASAPLPPTHVVAVNEDRSAVIKWEASQDVDTVGYKISWSTSGGEEQTLYTPDPDIQISPLDVGKTYRVFVQSINKNGDLSKAVGPVLAQSDASYVSSLAQQMTGMFDDFNDNAFNGLPNPLHWFTTVNDADTISKAFVSGIHNQLALFVKNSTYTDNASITMRSLLPFDFTNRTGTIAFDFDFGQKPITTGTGVGRSQWTLSISPTMADSVVNDAIYNGSSVIYPLEGFQLHMENDTISFRKVSGGNIVNEWDSTYSRVHPLRDINVLKHAILKISNAKAELYIDGILVLSASDINLGFSKGWIYNQQIALNLPKAHIPFALMHFDNIGFDSSQATQSSQVHTYTANGYGLSDRKTLDFFHPTVSYTITIPDSLQGELAERLFVDANVHTDVTPAVAVNGTSIAWPTFLGFGDNGNFDSRVFSLPLSTLHAGINTITFSVTDKSVFTIDLQNVHAEIEFPHNTQNSYTPYQVPFSGNDIETKIPSLAPIPGFGSKAPKDGESVKGTITVEVTADGSYSLLPTGRVNPITQIELDVDGVPQTLMTLDHPTVKTDQLLQFDTSKVNNGQHVLTITAYGQEKSSNGIIASMNSFSPILQNNPLDNASQLRRVIFIDNGQGAPTTVPTLVIPQITEIPTRIPSPTQAPSSATFSGTISFGVSQIGKFHDVGDGNHITGSRFATENIDIPINQAQVYISSVDAAPYNQYQVAIYTDDNGKPGSLLTTSESSTIVPNSWNSMPLRLTLKSNTWYWLVYNTNSLVQTKNNLVYTPGTENSGVSVAFPFGSWPTDLTGYTLGNWQYSLFLSSQQ